MLDAMDLKWPLEVSAFLFLMVRTVAGDCMFLLSRFLRMKAFARHLLRRFVLAVWSWSRLGRVKSAANRPAEVAFCFETVAHLLKDVRPCRIDCRMRSGCEDDIGGAAVLIRTLISGTRRGSQSK